MKKINILAMFDGLRGGMVAGEAAGFNTGYYYSSEIDKNAIKIGRKNYKHCVELGDITKVNVHDLDEIDLVIGGSPCQDFSMAGRRKGMFCEKEDVKVEVTTLEIYLKLKKEGFEFKGQSYLFWEFVFHLKEIQKINPNVKFMLENVKMSKRWEAIITEALGVKPVALCASALLPQTRLRYFWANWAIEEISNSQLSSVAIKDIMVSEDEKYKHVYMSNERLESLTASQGKGLGKTRPILHKPSRRQGYQVFDKNYKVECITTCAGGGRIPHVMLDSGVVRHMHSIELERCQGLESNYTEGVSTGARNKMIGNGWPVPVIVHIFQCLLSTGWMQD